MHNWSYGPLEFAAPAGEATVVELKVPHRGAINAIRLNQIDGGADDGNFRIFTKEAAALSAVGSSSSASLPGIDPDSYSVFGAKDITNGTFAEYEKSYGYRNRDGTYSVPIRRLWLVLEHNGGGENQYSISMEIELPDVISA